MKLLKECLKEELKRCTNHTSPVSLVGTEPYWHPHSLPRHSTGSVTHQLCPSGTCINLPTSPGASSDCRNISVVGSSGGACAGAFLFLDVDTDRVIDYICECAVTARSHWRHALRIHDYVKGAIDRFMTPDAGTASSSYRVLCHTITGSCSSRVWDVFCTQSRTSEACIHVRHI